MTAQNPRSAGAEAFAGPPRNLTERPDVLLSTFRVYGNAASV